MKLVNVFLSVLGIAGALLLFQNCGESIDYGAYDQSSSISSTAYAVPELLDQSVNLTKNVGQSAIFSASFNGGGLSYKWYKGTTLLSNSTTMLTLNNLDLTDQGTYKIEASNSAGSAIAEFTLTVNAPAPTPTVAPTPTPGPGPTPTPAPVAGPVITQHLQSPRMVNLKDNIYFEVQASGSNLQYQWKHNGSNVGSNTNSFIIYNAFYSAAGNVTVTVSNSSGSDSSSADIIVTDDGCFDTRENTFKEPNVITHCP